MPSMLKMLAVRFMIAPYSFSTDTGALLRLPSIIYILIHVLPGNRYSCVGKLMCASLYVLYSQDSFCVLILVERDALFVNTAALSYKCVRA